MVVEKRLVGRCTKLGNRKKYIIVHHSASSKQTTFQNLLRFFALSELVSCHYVVGKMGEVAQIVDENDIAWHAGKSSWQGDSYLNGCSIGIEILSDGELFSIEQRKTMVELCKDIMARNHIPPCRVLRHADVSPNRKWDVGEKFWNPYFGNTWGSFQKALMTSHRKGK
jgi:N-acetylmuramoyl-L-alanine amidase